MQKAVPIRVQLGAFELDLKAGELRKGAHTIRLQEQPFQILLMLVERAGELVTREEIKKKLWPNDTVVEFDHSIHTAISKLRQALGDSAESPKYVETVARRGYRLLVPVEWVVPEDSPSLSPKAGEKAGAPPDEDRGAPPLSPSFGDRVGIALTGRTVSHYRVLDIIGGGGMGVAYRAEDLKLGRQVALKFLPEELGSDSQALERFSREARAASSLDHPNICPIFEFGEHEGRPFMVMQLLEGQTLRDQLAKHERALPLAELLDIGIQVSDGLQAAHEKGIIHRDIKPANIFLTSKGVVKILDFGLAKLVEAGEMEQTLDGVIPSAERSEASRDPSNRNDLDGVGVPRLLGMTHENSGAAEACPERSRRAAPLPPATPVEHTLTRTGVAMGTAGYMSPEQVRGEKLDARTDIFSVGLVLYEMATGQRAFTGETAAVVHDAILNNSPVPARELNSRLPANLVTTIDKSLEKNREKRYQSAKDLRDQLSQVPRAKRKSKHHSRTWIAASALTMVLAVGGWWYWRSRNTVKLTNKDTVVLADITNSTGDPLMDDTLGMPLSQELQESPYVTLLNPSKVRESLRFLKVSEDAKLTPDLAQQVCLRTDSRAFVTGSIADAGNHYRIVLRALDCHSGKTLASAEAEADDRNQIVKTLGLAGHRLRRELGEPPDSLTRFNQPLEQDMSASLEALRAFSQGFHIQGEKGNAAAISFFQRAVELDSSFALAHLNLAGAYYGVGNTDLSTRHASKAFALRERLSQRSRFLTEANYYDMATGELEKANAIYRRWMEIFPADVYPHQNLSESLRTLGQHEMAASEAREAVRLTPNVGTYYILMTPFVYLNRLNEAKAVFEEATAQGIEDLSLRSCRYVVASLQQDSAGMQAQLSWAVARPGGKEWAIQQQGDTATYHGRFRAALGFYSEMPTYSPNSAISLTSTALRDVETGNAARANRAAEKALAAAPTGTLTRTLALALARAGAVDQAEKLAEDIDKASALDTLVQNYELPTIRAAIELDKDRPARAVEILQSALPYDLAVPADSFVGVYPAYLRGLAYLELGRGREAAAEFQKMVDHPGIVQDFVTAPLSHLYLARAQAMMGDKAAARKSYQDFLTLWKDADPDIPIYKQAKAEYARLR